MPQRARQILRAARQITVFFTAGSLSIDSLLQFEMLQAFDVSIPFMNARRFMIAFGAVCVNIIGVQTST